VSVIGVIPAAGRALRLQPLPLSKELLVVCGRPVIDVLLDRLVTAPCDEIRVVTRREKHDVAAHAGVRGAEVVYAQPESVADSLLAGLVRVRDEDVVLIGFPDTIWGPVDGFRQLLDARSEHPDDVALGLFAAEEPERSDVVEVVGDRVTSIAVKPAFTRSTLLWGCAAVRAGVLRGVAGWREPGAYFDTLARAGRVLGVRLDDPFIDIGTPQALERVLAGSLS
jgi:glucose-1-phosphate thymidylyltransferase